MLIIKIDQITIEKEKYMRNYYYKRQKLLSQLVNGVEELEMLVLINLNS